MPRKPDEGEVPEPRTGADPAIEAAYARWHERLKRVGAAGGAVAALVVWGMGVAGEGSLGRAGVGSMVVLFVGACVAAGAGAVVGTAISKAVARGHRDAYMGALRKDRDG